MKTNLIARFDPYWIFLIAPLLATCSVKELAGGSGSTTTNGMVVGRLVEGSGAPAARTKVMLVASGYDPVKDGPVPGSMSDTTDSLGEYAFAEINNGNYSIIAVHHETSAIALIRGVMVYENQTDTVAVDTLRPPGSIKVMTPPSVNMANGYIFIPGALSFAFLKNSSGYVMLDSVPVSSPADIAYSMTSASGSTLLRYGVQVKSGDTTVVWNSGWNHSRKIILNTSSSGAGVAGSVTNFPVLVRLNAGNFDFTQARTNGEDIRFTKSDNAFLPYEIERWDAIGKKAEIWVKVDTIRGSDNTQSFTIYWGNIDASAQSNSAAVFDTAAGFAGVWHLGQPAGPIVADATVNGIDGAATATATVSGAIGAAQAFNGTSSFIRTSGPNMDKLNFSDSAAYSVCAWVKTNVLDSIFHGVVYKSNVQYGLQMRPQNKWEFVTYIDKSRWEMSRSPAVDNAWHCIAGARSGTKQYLYIDGVCADSSVAVLESTLARAYDQPLEIGHCPDGGANPDRYFSGVIDEVRIARVAFGADWIKLCYMNQKETDALIRW